jgi:hypothetical protein
VKQTPISVSVLKSLFSFKIKVIFLFEYKIKYYKTWSRVGKQIKNIRKNFQDSSECFNACVNNI